MSKVTLLGDSSGKIELAAPNTISPNLTFILPDSDGTSGQVLATDGDGTLSFITNDGSASFATANSAGAYANAAFAAANSAASSSVDSTARAVANSLFDGTAEANVASLYVFDGGSILADYILEAGGEGNGGFLNLIAADTRLGNDQGPVKISAAEAQWTFADTGEIQLPGTGYLVPQDDNAGLILYDTDNNFRAQLAAIGDISLRANSANSGSEWTFGSDGTLSVPGSIDAYDAVILKAYYGPPGTYQEWSFDGHDGTLTVPGDISGANAITANTIIASNASIIHNLTVGAYLSVANVAIGWHTAPATSKGSPGDKAGWCAIDDEKLYRCIADYTDGTEDIWVFVLFTGGEWG